MSLPFHLVPDLGSHGALTVGATVTVEGDEAHHAVAVRRLRVGEQVALTDGAGTLVVGEVSTTGKRVFTVVVTSVESTARPAPELIVVQALPKGDRGELAVEMLTEIGVGRIVPWAASRSVAVWKGERAEKSLAKWRATAREAAKQARRTWHPDVDPLMSTAQVAELVGSVDLAVVLHEATSTSLAAIEQTGAATILLVVGPEGGLSQDEVASFEATGAHTVRLGAEVLRTSTAGVAAAAALLARTQRWA